MPKWKLATEFTFEAAHFIRDYKGPCGRMHGHTYRVRIEAVSSCLYPSEYSLSEVMVVDFRMLRWAKRNLNEGGLDPSVFNDVLPNGYETTSEMIAQYIYRQTKARLPADVKLKVCISKTPSSWIEYEESVGDDESNL